MQYHARVIYPKLRTLRNVSSKVEIFTYVRAEIFRAFCFSIPSSLPSPGPLVQAVRLYRHREEIYHRTKESDHKKKSYVLHSTDYRLQLELCSK